MRTTLFVLWMVIGCSAYCQDSIYLGKRITIYSQNLQEQRGVMVSLPADYTNPKYPGARYPVIYLLDAEWNFVSFTGIVQALSKGPYARMPQAIVVGIVNTNRTRDLTPTNGSRTAYFDNTSQLFKESGGNANFIKFLTKELRAYVDSAYRTNGFNLLNGHSFGGLTATNLLLHYPGAFNAYIIIDPSLWWDNGLMVQDAQALFSKTDFKNTHIYLALAHKEIIPQDTTTDQIESIKAFHGLLKQQKPNGLGWRFKYYENEDHGTIPIPAAFDGLKYIFDGHMVHAKQAVADSTLVDLHFQKLSERLGFPFKPSQAYLDWMADFCRAIGKPVMGDFYEGKRAQYYPVK